LTNLGFKHEVNLEEERKIVYSLKGIPISVDLELTTVVATLEGYNVSQGTYCSTFVLPAPQSITSTGGE